MIKEEECTFDGLAVRLKDQINIRGGHEKGQFITHI